ncbi:MAG: hypothetical protein ACRD0A_00945 [Acidimicrobiales bacterium]
MKRSFTVRGDAEHAEARRRELVADYRTDLSVLHASGMTVGELLTRWFAAGHAWKPSTRIVYDCDVRALCADPIATLRLCSLDPSGDASGDRMLAGDRCDRSDSVEPHQDAELGAALRWALEKGILRAHPLAGLRNSPQPLPRLPLPIDDVNACFGLRPRKWPTLAANGRRNACSRPSRPSCWSSWPPTPAHAAASWRH